jgi:hypothetical protein
MIILNKLVGGLANQLFIWANARSLELSGYKVSLDTSFYSQQDFRKYSLNLFPNIKVPEIFKGIDNNKKFIQITDDFIYRNFEFNEDFNYYLNGYWQSEKYFLDNEYIIREELAPNNATQFKLIEKYPDLLKESVSLHVRRTDYVNQPQNHPTQTIQYYKDALDIIGYYDKLYILSDDIDWCKENLKFDNMVFVQNDSDVEDLWTMSLCKHNIIANSSFSWWGAWLNSNPDKIVVAPSKWFGTNLNLPIDDLLPKDKWHII